MLLWSCEHAVSMTVMLGFLGSRATKAKDHQYYEAVFSMQRLAVILLLSTSTEAVFEGLAMQMLYLLAIQAGDFT